jgi:hypothetical protein
MIRSIACLALAALLLLGLGTTLRAQETLATQYEACSHNRLEVVGTEGRVIIPFAESSQGMILVRSPQIQWFCGTNEERTTCPPGTSRVRIQRTQERRFFVYCLR